MTIKMIQIQQHEKHQENNNTAGSAGIPTAAAKMNKSLMEINHNKKWQQRHNNNNNNPGTCSRRRRCLGRGHPSSIMLVSLSLLLLLSFTAVSVGSSVGNNNNSTRTGTMPSSTLQTVTNNRQLLGLRGGEQVEGEIGRSDNNNNNNNGGNSVTTLTSSSTTTTTATSAFLAHHQSHGTMAGIEIPISNFTIPLHAHSGSHHIFLYVGSPPQRQTLIIDTGSRAMAWPCGGQSPLQCKNCGIHASPYYNPDASTTARTSYCSSRPLGCKLIGVAQCSLFGDYCEINQRYTEGSSWTATEMEDIVWLGTSDVMESIDEYLQYGVFQAFGCQTSIKGLFKKQYADGILGLARHDTSIVAALASAQVIHRNAFSLCMTQTGGTMSLGGSLQPQLYHRGPVQITPITREHGWYSIRVIRLTIINREMIGGEISGSGISNEEYVINDPKHLKALNSGKGCILDSGTTDTYFPKSLAKTIKRMVFDRTGGMTDFSTKQRAKLMTYDEFQMLPIFKVEFTNDASIEIVPDNYMEGIPAIDPQTRSAQPWQGSVLLTNRIYLEDSESTVLGANAMFGYDILFDIHRHQIGIAKANC